LLSFSVSFVLLALSGGVDSSVLAALLNRAIGSQLKCIFVDNGLLRKGERESVETTFRDHFKIDLRVVDASARFLGELKGVTEPQEKRKIIGRNFIEVFQVEAKSIPNAHFLAQGTLYPDVIESGQSHAGKSFLLFSSFLCFLFFWFFLFVGMMIRTLVCVVEGASRPPNANAND
jgi:GMP synthase (glutamine-hydrolysing)